MWYVNTQPIIWTEDSKEVLSLELRDSYGTWQELGLNIAIQQSLDHATIQRERSANLLSQRWYKYVEEATGNTYYYILTNFSMKNNIYICQLTLDIKSTFVSPMFSTTNNINTTSVFVVNREIGDNDFMSFWTDTRKATWLKNLYSNHGNLLTKTDWTYNNFQGNLLYGALGEAGGLLNTTLNTIFPEQTYGSTTIPAVNVSAPLIFSYGVAQEVPPGASNQFLAQNLQQGEIIGYYPNSYKQYNYQNIRNSISYDNNSQPAINTMSILTNQAVCVDSNNQPYDFQATYPLQTTFYTEKGERLSNTYEHSLSPRYNSAAHNEYGTAYQIVDANNWSLQIPNSNNISNAEVYSPNTSFQAVNYFARLGFPQNVESIFSNQHNKDTYKLPFPLTLIPEEYNASNNTFTYNCIVLNTNFNDPGFFNNMIQITNEGYYQKAYYPTYSSFIGITSSEGEYGGGNGFYSTSANTIFPQPWVMTGASQGYYIPMFPYDWYVSTTTWRNYLNSLRINKTILHSPWLHILLSYCSNVFKETATNYYQQSIKITTINYKNFLTPETLYYIYLFNWHKTGMEYNGQKQTWTTFDLVSPFDYVSMNYAYNWSTNYPTNTFNVILAQNSSGMATRSIFSPLFSVPMAPSATTQFSPSQAFIDNHRSISMTSWTQNQNEQVMNGLKLAGLGIFDFFKIWASGSIVGLQNQNLSLAYSNEYGAARLQSENQAGNLAVLGNSTSAPALLLNYIKEELTEYDKSKVINDIEKYGYIFNKWMPFNLWYQRLYHNYFQVAEGADRLISPSVPSNYIPAILALLKSGMIIWTQWVPNHNYEFYYNSMYEDQFWANMEIPELNGISVWVDTENRNFKGWNQQLFQNFYNYNIPITWQEDINNLIENAPN